MKKIFLFIALVASPVFAQEEEQEVQIEIETGGGVEVATGSGIQNRSASAVIGFPDKSFFVYSNVADVVYCHINEDGNPRCEKVEIDD